MRGSVPPRRFYNEAMVSGRAAALLARHAARTRRPIALPVPVERIAENVCDLRILWEPIAEPPNRTILAGLVPSEHLVIFNETRRLLFDETRFLYHTVLAHEVGHWQLHVDQAALRHPLLPGFDRSFQFVCRRDSNAWVERHAHWFASHLLLPRDVLGPALAGLELPTWGELYRLRDRYQVTITLLRITMQGLGRGYVDERGRIHRSRREYEGQMRLL